MSGATIDTVVPAGEPWMGVVRAGQLFRIPAALTKSRIWVPRGNTGGANVSAFAPMAVPADLAPLVED